MSPATFVDMARDRVGTIQFAGAFTSLDAGVSFLAAPGTRIDFAVTHGLRRFGPGVPGGAGTVVQRPGYAFSAAQAAPT